MQRTVDVFELARDGGSVEGQVEAAELARLSGMPMHPVGPIRYVLQGRIDEHGRSAARLRLRGSLELACDLCGAPLAWELDESEGFFFLDDPEQIGALPITIEADEPLAGSRLFDLHGLVEEQAILALPISPRHPACEQQLQRDRPEEQGRRPFAVLAALKRGRSDIQ